MGTWKIRSLGSAALILASCSAYNGKNSTNGDKSGEEANGDKSGEAPNAEKAIGEAKAPIDALKDNKTFLALTDEEALHGLKEGEAQIKIVCDRNAGKTNKVITAFCTNALRPKSLVELQAALGLAFPAVTKPGRVNNGANGNGPAFAVQGHSSSLVGRFVSAINPRVILIDPTNLAANTNNPSAVVLAFVRGEQFSEIAVKNPSDGTFDFFLVGFKQTCNAKPEGCSIGELLTPSIEKDWISFTLYQDEDLKSSIVDCRQCHQPDGPQSQRILRMAELRAPWTHWFRDSTDGKLLIADYTAAWGTDGFGGIPGNMISSSDPLKLEIFLRGNNMLFNEVQSNNAAARLQTPNEFLTFAISREVGAAAAVAGPSGTWEALKKRFIARKDIAFTIANGTATPIDGTGTPKNYIQPPYRGLKISDPTKLASLTKQIQDFRAGALTTAQFKDTREIFPEDQQVVADMGFAVAPNETPQDILALACAQCHHSALDLTLTRARFNAVDFSKMANLNAELDVAIGRLKLGYTPERLKAEGIKFMLADGSETQMQKGEHLLTMPPRRFKQLTDAQIDSVVKFLESQKK